MAVGLIGRIYWAFVGNHHARELFTLPVLQKAYWVEVLTMLKWYAFLIPQPSRYVGHNPLARAAMFLGFFFLSLFMLVTGFCDVRRGPAGRLLGRPPVRLGHSDVGPITGRATPGTTSACGPW